MQRASTYHARAHGELAGVGVCVLARLTRQRSGVGECTDPRRKRDGCVSVREFAMKLLNDMRIATGCGHEYIISLEMQLVMSDAYLVTSTCAAHVALIKTCCL
uniref:Uncharacterized protein n=1 Tax=Calcidiscus leptoporus TaxID=127549 RepID=A0A7S0IRJ9_9EUKA|mmetsp:Transcript_19063/g.43850  ORF Transcript_19063/g.43850 Transcript_19063/m.43850 type:complete len:103 (+) Transcript_19063:619-927(+)